MFGTTLRLTAVMLGTIAAIATNDNGTRTLTYHAHLMGVDSAGTYHWAGEVGGAITGRADVEAMFDAGTIPGGQPIRAQWHVTAKPDSLSFDASLSGVMDPTTGKTHLVGAIIRGNGRGRMIETRSQWLSRGSDSTLSTDGVMAISLPSTSPTYASRRGVS